VQARGGKGSTLYRLLKKLRVLIKPKKETDEFEEQ